MRRVRSLGLPASTNARIAKSLYIVGLYGAEIEGMSASHMRDVRISTSLGTKLIKRSSGTRLSASWPKWRKTALISMAWKPV
eukprot:4860245-Amphidinium_carterae.2